MAIGTGAAILGAGALSAGASIYGASKAGGGKARQVDIQGTQDLATRIAEENARKSIELEQELTPEVAQLRRQSIEALLGDINGTDQYSNLLRDSYAAQLTGDGGGDINLLRLAQERATEDLQRGGNLPLDVRNQVTRVAAANAAGIGGGGLGLGRDVAARDLGLTSLDLRDRSLTNALSSGQAYFNAGQAQLANRQSALSGLQGLSATEFGRRQALAMLGQSIERPEVGLAPGSVADLAVGNVNSQNAAAQQRAAINAQMYNSLGQLGGQLIGSGLGMMGQSSAPQISYNATPQGGFSYGTYTPPSGNYAGSMIPGLF